MDTPGQLELFVFREAGKYIIEFLNPERTMIGYILDPSLAKNPSGFTSQLLLALNTSFRLSKPQINILSKKDMLSDEDLDRIIKWSENPDFLENDILSENPSIYQEMSRSLINLIKDFQSELKIYPTSKEDMSGISDIYAITQMRFFGGGDVLKD